jgi:hypothetical protein
MCFSPPRNFWPLEAAKEAKSCNRMTPMRSGLPNIQAIPSILGNPLLGCFSWQLQTIPKQNMLKRNAEMHPIYFEFHTKNQGNKKKNRKKILSIFIEF